MYGIKKLDLTPTQLDAQSTIVIEKWLNIDSEECKDKDSDIAITKKFLRIGAEDGFLMVDSLGRVWGDSEKGGVHYPFHIEYGKKLYGIRIATSAAN